MSISKRLSKTALKLLKKYGNAAVLSEVSYGERNIDTGVQEKITVDNDVMIFEEKNKTSDIQQGMNDTYDYKSILYYKDKIKKGWEINGNKIEEVEVVSTQGVAVLQYIYYNK